MKNLDMPSLEATTILRRNDLQAIGGRLLTESHMLSAMVA